MAEGGEELEIQAKESSSSQQPEILLNGSRKSPDRCRYTSFDVNEEKGVAVCVADVGLSRALSYKVGRYKRDTNKIVEWGNRVVYDSGRFPNVAIIENKGVCYAVEVHNPDFNQNLYCRLGEVNLNDLRIDWCDNNYGTRIGDGKKPKISTSGNKIILVYEDASVLHLHDIRCRVGTLQRADAPVKKKSSSQNSPGASNAGTVTTGGNASVFIHWHSDTEITNISGVEPDVSAQGDTVAVAFRSNVFQRQIHAIIGEMSGDNIQWIGKPARCDTGWNPCISMNEKNNVVVIYQGLGRKMWLKGGKIQGGKTESEENDGHKIKWLESTQGSPGDGEYPTIFLSCDDNIIVRHKANFTHSFYQREGRIEHF